jgi:hypothetical protein
MENHDSQIQALMTIHGFNLGTAQAYVEWKGRCAYCGADCLVTAQSYWSSQIDHLLPKKKYPKLTLEPDNMVVSCFSCNNIKKGMDILTIDPELAELKNKGLQPIDILNRFKRQAIEAIKEQLKAKLAKRDADYSAIRAIVTGQANT